MTRIPITTLWDRKTRDDLNSMFIELYKEIKDLGTLSDSQLQKLEGLVEDLRDDIFVESKNLFKGIYDDGLLVRMYDDNDEYIYTYRVNYNVYLGKTAVLEVNPGTTYSIKTHNNTSNVLRVGYSKDRIYPGGGNGNVIEGYAYFSSAGNKLDREFVFRVPNNYRYLYVYVSNEGMESDLQVEVGSSPTDYVTSRSLNVSWGDLGEVPDEYIDPENTTFFTKSKNLFDGDYTDGLIVTNPSDIFPQITTTANLNNYGVLIPIDLGETYTISKLEGGNRFVILGLPEYPTESNMPLRSTYHYRGLDDDSEQHHTFYNDNSRFIFIATNFRNTDIPKVQVEKGNSYTGYEDPAKIKKHLIDLDEMANNDVDYRFNFFTNLDTLFRLDSIIDDYIDDPSNLTVEGYHSLFYSLISEHDIARRTKLGDVTGGYPLYKYEIKPEDYWVEYTNDSGGNGGRIQPLPKIFITTGIHGNERSPNISAYYMFKYILENPENNPVLDFLKMNIHIILIPICNPSGWTSNTYNNANNKNLNRQFPPLLEQPTESEAVLIKNQIDVNKDSDIFIDFHNMFFRDGYLGYTLTNSEIFKITMNNLYRNIGYYWSRENTSMPQDLSHVWGYNAIPNNGTVANYAGVKHKIDSSLIEVIRDNRWVGDGDFGESTGRLGVEMLVNSIIGVLRSK